jgi:FkbM family methyltransferase
VFARGEREIIRVFALGAVVSGFHDGVLGVEKSFFGFSHLKYMVVDPATYPYGQGTFDDPEPIMPIWAKIKRGDYVIDIGAAFGCYTLAALAMGAYVDAFEPSTDGYRILSENVRLNGWGDQCVVHKTALFNGLGYPEALKREVMGFHYVASDAYEEGTLDEVMNGRRVNFIKIDVEGAELGVLQGGFRTILTHRPMLLIEDHDSDVDRWEVCRYPKSIRSSARIQSLLDSLDYAFEVVPSAADRRYIVGRPR